MSIVKAILISMRPHQWAKNTLIFAPLLFALKLTDIHAITKSTLAFLSFCILSGSVYILNDLMDIKQDREHPHKKFRPIASGAFPEPLAWKFWPTASFLALAITALLSWTATGIAAVYFAINVGYSFRLKRIPYIDVALIASGFLLRVMIGIVVLHVDISRWILPCTFALALYLALGKRRHELATYGDHSVTRSVLKYYDMRKLDLALGIVASLTVLAYCGYTLDPQTLKKFQTPYLIYTIPMIVFAIVRFHQLMEKKGETESPTQELLRDIPSLLNVLLWLLAVIYILYTRPGSSLLCGTG